jgi:hypothetical protein
MYSELELAKEQHDQAYGALGAAEDISWGGAIFVAIAAHQQWANWFVTVAAFFVAYFGATWKYRRAEQRTEDVYYRLAGLGKYSPHRR